MPLIDRAQAERKQLSSETVVLSPVTRGSKKKGRRIRKDKSLYDLVQTCENDDNLSLPDKSSLSVKGPRAPRQKNAMASKKYAHDLDEGLNCIISSGDSDTDDISKSSSQSDLSSIQTADLEHTSILKSECYAPPGKLGIAIDTVNGQPVLHRVKETSPLFGVLRRLDIIIAVDEVDTSSMSAAVVTSLMAKKIGKQRKITFLRGGGAQALLR